MPKLRTLYTLTAFIALLASSSGIALGDDFYEDKVIRIIVGYSPGGGYDTYARLIAREMGKYIPGNPTIIVQNMPGAGGLVTANYIYNKGKPNGLNLAVINNSFVVEKALGRRGIRFDPEKFGWIGAPSKGVPSCMIMGFSGFKTLDDILKAKRPIRMGSTGTGANTDVPKILNKTLGTQFELVPGYRGTASLRLALQRKEIEGFCSQWESMRSTARAMLDAQGDKKLIPYIIHSRQEDPEVRDLPLFREVIKGKDNLATYNAWAAQMDFQRPFVVPPGTSRERIEVLRKAFKSTLSDPDFLAAAKKSRLVVDYVSGEEIEKLVAQIIGMSPEVKSNLEFLVRKKK